MTLQNSGEIKWSEISSEFGTPGGKNLGAYRVSDSPGNNCSLSNLPLDSGIPQSGEIKFSNFYGKSLNVVVDCHSGGTEYLRNAKSHKWNNNAVTVIGRFRGKKEAGSRILINVNKTFGAMSHGGNGFGDQCALKTGGWSSPAEVKVDVGGGGRLYGGGGAGGNGADGNRNGVQRGGGGTSGLGIQVNNCKVHVASGGLIRAGYGGGGGGGAARQVDKGEDRRATGGGGGGGAGLPAGGGGQPGAQNASKTDNTRRAVAGGAGGLNNAGGGGYGGIAGGNQAYGGSGGNGGYLGAASGGQTAGGNRGDNAGGAGGDIGAAIRKTAGFVVHLTSAPGATVIGSVDATGVA